MGKGSNTLTSHHGESNTSRDDKMSGWIKDIKKVSKKKGGYSIAKGISNKKRRMFLNNDKMWDKI